MVLVLLASAALTDLFGYLAFVNLVLAICDQIAVAVENTRLAAWANATPAATTTCTIWSPRTCGH